jgi:hypothetical protein
MPDRRRAPTPPRVDPLTASARVITQAQIGDRNLFQYESWQNEAWGYWRDLGPFNYGITWLSNALSRVRLMAAELVPGGDEPAPLTEGPAADLMEQFAGGLPGQAAVMKALGTQVGVPGEGWLVARRTDPKVPLWMADWSVMSTSAIRPARGRAGTGGFEVRVDDAVWEPLPTESLVTRIWEPDAQFPWRAHSSARAALGIMRRIDLLERRIVATLVSRLAMNGLLLIPQEGTITVPEQYGDSPDPFVKMLIEIASNNIRNPGGASASLPIPIRFQSDLIEKWTHLTFGDGIAEELLKEREAEIRLLATTLNMPAEVLLGMGDVNHWSAWQLEESGIKLHISPVAETIVNGLTVGYLHPMLDASGEDIVGPNGGKVVVWYDASELTARPDKSASTLSAYDRIEASGTALRRESGLDESDKPSKEEVREQLLKKLAAMPATALTAMAQLLGEPVPQAPVPGAPARGPGADGEGDGPPGEPSTSPAQAAPGTGPPPTRDNPPPPPGPDVPGSASISGPAAGRLAEALSRTSPASRFAPTVRWPVNGNKPGAKPDVKPRDGPRRRR